MPTPSGQPTTSLDFSSVNATVPGYYGLQNTVVILPYRKPDPPAIPPTRQAPLTIPPQTAQTPQATKAAPVTITPPQPQTPKPPRDTFAAAPPFVAHRAPAAPIEHDIIMPPPPPRAKSRIKPKTPKVKRTVPTFHLPNLSSFVSGLGKFKISMSVPKPLKERLQTKRPPSPVIKKKVGRLAASFPARPLSWWPKSPLGKITANIGIGGVLIYFCPGFGLKTLGVMAVAAYGVVAISRELWREHKTSRTTKTSQPTPV